MQKKFITLAVATALTISMFSTGVYAAETNNSATTQTSISEYANTNIDSLISDNSNLSLEEQSKLLSVGNELKSLKEQSDALEKLWESTDDDSVKADINTQSEAVNSQMVEKLDTVKDIISKAKSSENYGIDIESILSDSTNLTLEDKVKLEEVSNEIEALKENQKALEEVWVSSDDYTEKTDAAVQAEDINARVNEKLNSVKDIVTKAKSSANYGVDLDKIISENTNLSLKEICELSAVNNDIKDLKAQAETIENAWQSNEGGISETSTNTQIQAINAQINEKLDSVKDIVAIAKTSASFGIDLDKMISDNINLSPEEESKLIAVNSEINSLKEQLTSLKEIWAYLDEDAEKADAITQTEDIHTQINAKLGSINDIIQKVVVAGE
jgi:hypothetical protein